jgi:hypothetical protein
MEPESGCLTGQTRRTFLRAGLGAAALGVSAAAGEYERLRNNLQQAHEASALPEASHGTSALHDLIVRLRLRVGDEIDALVREH